MLRRGCIRKGCLVAAVCVLTLPVAIWLLAPGAVDTVFDWALYVDPPEVNVSPTGRRNVREAMIGLYGTLSGEERAERIVVSEGDLNGFLGEPSVGSELEAVRIDLTENAAVLYAGIDLAKASASGDYADLLADVPTVLRRRRVIVRLLLERLTTEGDRLGFESATVRVGRVWVPFAGRWALPLLQRAAEQKLGTRLPENGLPLPVGSTARIADDTLTVDFGPPPATRSREAPSPKGRDGR